MSAYTDPTPRPWKEGEAPTADQMAQFLAICTHAERVAFANAYMVIGKDVQECYRANHAKTIQELSKIIYEMSERRVNSVVWWTPDGLVMT